MLELVFLLDLLYELFELVVFFVDLIQRGVVVHLVRRKGELQLIQLRVRLFQQLLLIIQLLLYLLEQTVELDRLRALLVRERS